MSSVAALLLLLIAVVHYGIDPICSLVPSLEHSTKALFYVLRGLEGVVLFAVIGFMCRVLWPICAWGALEEGETAVCRLVAGPLDRPPAAVAWSGLCGEASGLPWYSIGLVIAAMLATGKRQR